jgi:lipid A 3-O-deacylase
MLPGGACHAAVDWLSFTWDNDIFVGEDDGYTNGGFWTWFNTGRRDGKPPEPSWLLKPLLWSMPEEADPVYRVNSHTFGHMMMTPHDVTRAEPDPDDLLYAGLVYYLNGHLRVYESYADLAGVTIGLVGPKSGADTLQKFIHKRLGDSDEPQGWHTQLDNEVVFRLSRTRVWRRGVSRTGRGDLLFVGGVDVGTLESSLDGYLIFRYGADLAASYATAAYHGNRAINPVALNGGWHVYAGVGAHYIGNQIFTDGNTFRESRSIEVDPAKFGYVVGFAYSWRNFTATLAIEDMATNEERYKGIERYGSFSVAYRFE